MAVAFYAAACLFSNYFLLLDFLPDSAPIERISNVLKFVNRNFPVYLTFLNGVVFVLLGRLFAEREQLFRFRTQKILLCICPILAYIELFVAMYFSLNVATDCFFMLVPLSAVVFQSIKSIRIKPRAIYRRMREQSTFMYLFQFVFLYPFYQFVYSFGWTLFISNVPVTLLIYVIFVTLSNCLCTEGLWLSKRRGRRFLNYCV